MLVSSGLERSFQSTPPVMACKRFSGDTQGFRLKGVQPFCLQHMAVGSIVFLTSSSDLDAADFGELGRTCRAAGDTPLE